MCPLGRRWLLGEGGWLDPAPVCCHCLLIEGRHGLILVDTGLGTGDVSNPARLGPLLNLLLRPRLQMSDTALHQIRELGLDPRDVQHIVPTHLDLDHAGALGDFPQARVHVHATELDAALRRSAWLERSRYVPAQWAHGPNWVAHRTGGERWLGLEAIQALPGTDDEVLLVPLHGHTRGHCGVAVRGEQGWLLHGGDAYFHHGEMLAEPHCPPGMRFFQWVMQMDGASRLANQARLRALKQTHGNEVSVFCAHDTHEFAAMQRQAPSRLPSHLDQ